MTIYEKGYILFLNSREGVKRLIYYAYQVKEYLDRYSFINNLDEAKEKEAA